MDYHFLSVQPTFSISILLKKLQNILYLEVIINLGQKSSEKNLTMLALMEV